MKWAAKHYGANRLIWEDFIGFLSRNYKRFIQRTQRELSRVRKATGKTK